MRAAPPRSSCWTESGATRALVIPGQLVPDRQCQAACGATVFSPMLSCRSWCAALSSAVPRVPQVLRTVATLPADVSAATRAGGSPGPDASLGLFFVALQA